MNPSLARLFFAAGIAGLFYLNRDKAVRTSAALWVPFIWFSLAGSRPITAWFGQGPAVATPSAEQLMEGSPTDRLVFEALIAVGLAILLSRGRRPLEVMKSGWPIILYFAYCLVSVVWSDFPDVAIKRWIKATGDVIMILVVVTDAEPLGALRRLFSRMGFILLPASVLLIKYFPAMGRAFDQWSGQPYDTGVTRDKNLLGVLTYVLTMGAWWQFLRLWKNRDLPNRFRQLLAQGTLIGFGIFLLLNAHSATSGTCFTLGAILMVATGLRRFKGRPSAVHALIITFLVVGALIKFTGADTLVVQAIGRNPTLTGRTDIWALLIPMAPNPLVGAGFESFWLGPRLLKVWAAFPGNPVNEAHNGYIEVYLNLGVIGVALILLILIHGYRRAIAAFRVDPGSGGLMLAYVVTSVLYSYTEAGFRALDLSWSFLLLAVIAASRIAQLGGETPRNGAPSQAVAKAPVGTSPGR